MARHGTRRRRLHDSSGALRALVVLLVLCPSIALCRDRRDGRENTWKMTETLASRLGAEWYKIGVLNRELGSVRDVLAGMRNFELYPPEVTRLTDERVVTLDETIEQAEKRADKLESRIEALRPRLADAIAILREMVVGEPVSDMFTALERGDLERIDEMLAVKHDIDSLWGEAGRLLEAISAEMGLPGAAQPDTEGIDPEFIAIVKASLGRQSEEYLARMTRVRDSLARRADDPQLRRMFEAEKQLVREDMEKGRYRLAKRRVLAMRKRYEGRIRHDEVDRLLVRVCFLLGEYHAALGAAEELPLGDPEAAVTRALYTVQSRYALQEYRAVWDWAASYDFSFLSGETRNILLWMAMESGLALGIEADYSVLAEKVVRNAPYSGHVLHGLAKSYSVKDEWGTALQVLKSAVRLDVHGVVDRHARRRVQLALAQTYYELGEYENALNGFFALLTQEESFEEALYGIAWCYTKLGSFGKAETSLRKLINQSPTSPKAADAFLVMAKRYVNKAEYEWKRLQYISRAEQGYRDALARLSAGMEADSAGRSPEKLREAARELRQALATLEGEERLGYEEMAAYYQRAIRICDFVTTHYETGAYHEATFSAKREKLLHRLDSLTAAVEGRDSDVVERSATVRARRGDILRVKEVVQRATVMTAEIQLLRYRWEREWLDWRKTVAKSVYTRNARSCGAGADSAVIDTCARLRERYTRLLDTLVARGDRVEAQWSGTIERSCTELLDSPLSPRDESYLRYHLGEIYYARENEEYAKAYDEFELARRRYAEQLSLFHDGKIDPMPQRPEQPTLDHDRSIRQFRLALSRDPAGELGAALRYSLAWCYNDLGLFDSATANMELVASSYPRSRYAPQAWMYLGEHHFDYGRLDKAIEAYQAVMKYPETEWFDEALYKLAWSQYRLSNPEKAISSFLALVDLGEAEAHGKALLEKESLDYIAISFSESDVTGEKGLKRAALFVERFGDKRKGMQILDRLAGVYREQGRYDMAKRTYRTLLSMYPDNPRSPMVESELLAVLERDLPMEEINERKVSLFRKYNNKSAWARSIEDRDLVAEADSVAAHQLYDASLSYHQLALQNNDSAAYASAAELYESYIHHYPTSPRANECHYNLAEILFSLGDYFRAAEEYMAVSKRYPDSKYRETAAWNAIVASQNLLKQEEEAR